MPSTGWRRAKKTSNFSYEEAGGVRTKEANRQPQSEPSGELPGQLWVQIHAERLKNLEFDVRGQQ
jgi:hypothetical protein